MAAPTVTRAADATPSRAPAYRTDLDGLRGIAIALVACFHVWFGRVSGGVDVFLTLSGYFFVGSLLRHSIRSQSDTVGLIDAVNPFPRVRKLIRRLLPALVTMLIAVAVLTVAVVAQTRWVSIGREWIASLLYYQNWYLAFNSQDYTAASSANSPLQHIWSMSMQGQFFVGVLLAAMALTGVVKIIGRILGRTATAAVMRSLVFVVVLALAATSFAWAQYRMSVNQPFNYYDTFSRLWEPLIGGLLAIWMPRVRLPRLLRDLVILVALGLIISCGWWINGVESYPGAKALVPVVSTLAIIWAGAPTSADATPPRTTVALAGRGPVWLGSVSYSLYLWHWPLLIFYLTWQGKNHAGVIEGLLILALSLVVAWLTKTLVEDPLRGIRPRARPTVTEEATAADGVGSAADAPLDDLLPDSPVPSSDPQPRPTAGSALQNSTSGWVTIQPENVDPHARSRSRSSTPSAGTGRTGRWARALLTYSTVVTTVLVLATAAVVVSIRMWEHHVSTATVDTADLDPKIYPGGRAFLENLPVAHVDPQPTPLTVLKDLPITSFRGDISNFTDPSIRVGVYGDPTATHTIALAGGSHAEHWITALDILGKRNHFRVTTYLKMGCPLSADPNPTQLGQPYPQCHDWVVRVMDRIIADRPDAVFTNSTRPRDGITGGDAVPADYLPIFGQFSAAGIPVFGIRDTPWPHNSAGGAIDTPTCLADGNDPDTTCATQRSTALDPVNPTDAIVANYPGLHPLDLSNAVCNAQICPAVVGNIIVYHDWHHLSATFVRSITDELGRQMHNALPWA
ncbi:hypothetical protein GCM10027169_10610 [Gordonia jinhuaensis]|uniref:Peptidoglycan/LPS O-acetylase OafA/YrhL, contains acyltransferase and SGNH-hydrolase domains n=1 Tax=Gordonia jinhuaensis TaxID=1517702 RepID=A0A916WQC4_9ACTN|nr:acyltransferase family protein [Gordonia jinhuaensis]GGB19696.1 hypothetical protein GCM10011489_04770 [Gordonia jinhuaensis]